MVKFIKKIFIDKDKVAHTFHFARIFTTEGVNYFVTIARKDHNHFVFRMKQQGLAWIFFDPATLPLWILNIQDELSQSIIDNNFKVDFKESDS